MALLRKPSSNQQKTQKKVTGNLHVVVDSMSLAYAAYFGIKAKLSNGEQRTEIIYGFLNSLLDIYKRYGSSKFIFAFDSRRSLRKERFPWYKMRTTKLKDEEKQEKEQIFKQFDQLRRFVLPRIGFQNIHYQNGYEADDLIASIIHNNELPFMAVSGDEDLFQLLDRCTIYQPRKKQIYTQNDLMDAYGITPKQWIDVKRLGGCTSDKVPGIEDVGPATAIAFIKNELNPGKRLDRINKDMADGNTSSVWRRNQWLVELPLPGTRVIKVSFEKEKLSEEGFLEVCQRYSFHFMDKGNRKDWLQFLNN